MNSAGIAFIVVILAGMAALAWFVYRDRQHSASAAAPISIDDAPAAPSPPKPSLQDLANQLDQLWTKQTPLTELAETCDKPWPTDHAATLLTAWRNQQAS